MDKDGYPDEEELETIRKWPFDDFVGLMEYIEPLWRYADCGYWRMGRIYYHLSTGGWSGNEEIIGAMESNCVWWLLHAFSWRVGGHYVFKKRKTGD